MIRPIIFGKFILLERISVGGMAEVYRAKLLNQPQFGRYFAIKRILPNLAKDEEFVSMFINEAKVAVELENPNVCQIYELGRLGQSHYIAMEYISGRDIAAIQSYYRRQRKIMSVSQACYIIAQAAQGLDYAHKAVDSKTGQPLNLIHRDVSPQNLLADFSGLVKLIDFGVAKASQRTSNTKTGVKKGKFSYMSPEQASDLPIDHRSDIFALGVIFWELLTGRRLFISESEYAILEMVKECQIEKPSKYNKMIPDVVDRICMKALEKDPNQRYAWASDMIMDLMEFISSCEPPYTMWHLATWLQTTFSAMYAEESAKHQIFEMINTEADIEAYNKEHAHDISEDKAIDRQGNIIPEIGADGASEGEIFTDSKTDSPKMPDIPGRLSLNASKLPKGRKSITSLPVVPMGGDQHLDSHRIDLKKLEEARKAEEAPVDEFDPNVELTPEGVAPTISDPEHSRMRRIQRKNMQRRRLVGTIITVCTLFIIASILVLTNVIALPAPVPNLPTEANLSLSVVPDVDAARRANIEIYNYPRTENAAPIASSVGAKATFEHLKDGRYEIAVDMDGYESETFTVNLQNGTSESRLEMTHALPIIVDYEVTLSPEDSRLYVNGELERAAGALRHLSGKVGETYTLKVTRSGYAPVTKTFKLEENELEYAFTLEKQLGAVEVKANRNATAYICTEDGKCVDKGSTPTLITNLDASENDITLEVRASGCQTWKKHLDFDEQSEYRVFADLVED